MQVTTEPQCAVLPNPDELTDVHELRAALKSAYELLNRMADSTRQGSSAIRYLMGVIAPVMAAHQQDDHIEVKRLLDTYIASGEFRVQQPVVH